MESEAEVGRFYINGHCGKELQTCLQEMGHTQLSTPVMMDNLPTEEIINRKVKQRNTRAMLMRYYWIQDRGKLIVLSISLVTHLVGLAIGVLASFGVQTAALSLKPVVPNGQVNSAGNNTGQHLVSGFQWATWVSLTWIGQISLLRKNALRTP
eukprot:12885152-Ditylum_brightwellii.AAC.1